jgi:superfamily II DNA or RNA helicase
LSDAIDFSRPGLRVRLITDPAVSGLTTGRVRTQGPFQLVQIDIGPNNRPYKRAQHLELMPEGPEQIDDLIRAGRLGGDTDLSRTIAFHKIRGDLTNVLYSMEASYTDFYAHQFKPVLKFIDSLSGRILIADEVGLGKTIEATYIWKEVEAREQGQRLLIACPSMLREKWKSDLSRLFGIEAQILNAKDVLEKFERARSLPDKTPFVIISSYEGLRPRKNFERASGDKISASDKLAKLISNGVDDGEDPILDLVIFDEAHYLRNEETQSHLLARLLVDAAAHTVLLSATPVQTSSDNLFSLLRLLDPDHFVSKEEFGEMLASNAPLVQAQRALWTNPPDISEVNACLLEALASTYFEGDQVLEGIRKEVNDLGNIPPSKRVELGRRLEVHSLLGSYITRTRKREVEENRVERAPTILNINFSQLEREIYDNVTEELRGRAKDLKGFDLFPIIGRQREMASSLPAAFQSWREKDVLQEILWEDLGVVAEPSSRAEEELEAAIETIEFNQDLVSRLEADDTKYHALRDQFLKPFLIGEPEEKVIIFAFFRGTLTYLERRLKADGFNVGLIMGGQAEETQKVLERFAELDGPQILLSSEVGSEGIDLQFCRVLVNYDLPWNPMRLEQRIGRIDRLGQKAERITIVNLVVEDTVEDKILMRLYDRIQIFRESIGDLEEILGEVSQSLQVEIFDPTLSDAERERRAANKELVIENKRKDQSEVAEQAINLIGFSDYLLEAVNETRELGRWVSPEETLAVVTDFFQDNFPGTVIKLEKMEPLTASIELSPEARAVLKQYIDRKPSRRTRLSRERRPIQCIFDPSKTESIGSRLEAIDPAHPLIRWILSRFEASDRSLLKAVALEFEAGELGIEAGDYAFAVECWTMKGLRRDSMMSYSGVRLEDMSPVDATLMEQVVTKAVRRGKTIPAQALSNEVKEDCADGYGLSSEALEKAFFDRYTRFSLENEARCDQQTRSAERLADRKIGSIEDRIYSMKLSGRTRTIAANEGQIKKQKEILQERLTMIGGKLEPDFDISEIAGGLIRILPSSGRVA